MIQIQLNKTKTIVYVSICADVLPCKVYFHYIPFYRLEAYYMNTGSSRNKRLKHNFKIQKCK